MRKIKVGDVVRVIATDEEIREEDAHPSPSETIEGYVSGEVFTVGYVYSRCIGKSEESLWLRQEHVELVNQPDTKAMAEVLDLYRAERDEARAERDAARAEVERLRAELMAFIAEADVLRARVAELEAAKPSAGDEPLTSEQARELMREGEQVARDFKARMRGEWAGAAERVVAAAKAERSLLKKPFGEPFDGPGFAVERSNERAPGARREDEKPADPHAWAKPGVWAVPIAEAEAVSSGTAIKLRMVDPGCGPSWWQGVGVEPALGATMVFVPSRRPATPEESARFEAELARPKRPGGEDPVKPRRPLPWE